QLIAKQVSDVFPASVDDLPLADAARRGLIAPLRSLRVPPAPSLHPPPAAGRCGPAGPDPPAALSARSPGRGDPHRADRRRRLRGASPGAGARPPGAEPGCRDPLPCPPLLDAPA